MKFRTSIVWAGPSQLDGHTPLMLLLVPDSGNEKTGPMWQTYIVRSDAPPLAAIKARDTSATCGACPLQQRGCYAERMQGLISISRYMDAKGYQATSLDEAGKALAASD